MRPKIVQKECKHHGLTDYTSENHNTRYRCKKCRAEAVIKRRKKVKQMAVEYKGGKCCKCGYNKCLAALDFHHVDETKKDFGIAQNGNTYSWERTKRELDKCILVCSNCHREIHFKN